MSTVITETAEKQRAFRALVLPWGAFPESIVNLANYGRKLVTTELATIVG